MPWCMCTCLAALTHEMRLPLRWIGAAKALPLAPCNADEAGALMEACTAAAQLFSDLMLSHLPHKPKIAAGVTPSKIGVLLT